MDLKRLLKIDIAPKQSAFLWGLRKSGKSTYLKKNFPKSIYIDLLKKDIFTKYLKAPNLLREELLALDKADLKYPVIIDEIQKVPDLLDEVHWLIENSSAYFILCGSSARKLRRGAANLLGGRAWSFHMHPLCTREIQDFDLLHAMNSGLIPSHYLSKNYRRSLNAYVEEYLKEEIQAEALVRNLQSFARFLDIFAYSNGELTNYSNIARDCGVDAKTIKEYYQILIDTLMGYYIYPFTGSDSRDTIRATPKFYLADLGIASFLSKKTFLDLKGTEAGHAFEHFILMEIIAYKDLKEKFFNIYFWRIKNNLEVDFVINQAEFAIEVKISKQIQKKDLKPLIEFKKRYPKSKAIAVSLDDKKRKIVIDENIEIMVYPYMEFLDLMWTEKLF